jgi:NAD+ synthase (glutamine-hydrolysing)
MQIALAQLNYHTGNFEQNLQKMLDALQKAQTAGADLVVFAELAICGYPPRDFLEFDHFIQACEAAVDRLATACTSIAAIVGMPVYNQQEQGKRLYNAAVLLENGRISRIVAKSLLPTYDVFDEYRYFEAAKSTDIVAFKGKRIALTICEDLWNVGKHAQYPQSPMDRLAAQNPDLIINIAASPFSANQQAERLGVLGENARLYGLPLLYVNHIGAQTELIFDGNSMALQADGSVACQLKAFEEDWAMVKLQDKRWVVDQTTKSEKATTMAAVAKALELGIADYFGKQGFQKALLGLSGGVDSALVAVLAARALGPENVLAVLMPSRYSSQHSIDDSLALVNNLGIQHRIIPIEPAFNAFEAGLEPAFAGLQADLTEENLQARIRGTLLMALSNKFGHILLNTSNKSELAVGYGTLYGDMCGGLSVIGDLYKTEVYALCDYLNSLSPVIPQNILTKAPSAELRPDQKDSDSLPEYALLDDLLYRYIHLRLAPAQLIAAGFEAALVAKVIGLVNRNEYKRHQAPPILRVSNKAFGMGRRFPIVARYLN